MNDQKYLPWLSRDIYERFSFPNLFIDRDGLLELSVEQKIQFGGWKRPSQIMSDPQMIIFISSNSIIQVSIILFKNYIFKSHKNHINFNSIKDIVTDCSFVASLCVSSAYEKRFKKPVKIKSKFLKIKTNFIKKTSFYIY